MAAVVHPGAEVPGFGYVETTYEIDGMEVSREEYERYVAYGPSDEWCCETPWYHQPWCSNK